MSSPAVHPPRTDIEATAPAAQVRDIRLAGVAAAGIVAAGSLLDLGVLARILSAIPCFLGFLWMLWDDKQQTWHDKMTSSLVLKDQ